MIADTVVSLLLAAVNAASQYGALLSQAKVEGRDVSLDDLKKLRAQDDTIAAALDAAIAAHGG